MFSATMNNPIRRRATTTRRVKRLVSLVMCIVGGGLMIGCFMEPSALQLPLVLSISPARGPVLGGTRVTIIPKTWFAPPFGPGTEVLFGAFLATDVEVVDETTIHVTVPAQAAGTVAVTVRTIAGATLTQPDGFEYVSIEDADAEIVAQIEAMFPGPPRVVSAVSTGNTSVRVTFSEPVREGVTDALNYNIVIPEGGHLLLDQSKAPQPSEDHTVVELTTLSQADAFYRLTVTGIQDLAGNPIAPPDMLVNPAEATFTGIAPVNLDEHIDSDGDGFADWFEMLGWPITIELANGQRVQGYVTSDPFNPDTDGDGLSDAEENARSMDPRTDDTDADLVPDAVEIYDWRSNPNDQDSDDDGFSDKTELQFGTSLILADTDGDQLDDLDELLHRSRNPRIADLPIVAISVGEMNLELDQRFSYTDQFGEEHQVQESFSNTLQRDMSSSISNTSSKVATWHVEGKAGFRAGYEANVEIAKTATGPEARAGLKVYGEVHAEISGGYAEERARSNTTESSQAMSRTYNEAVSRVSQLSSISGITRETVAALLSGAVTISAASDVAFQVSDIEISVLQQDPRDRSRLTPIATLVPNQPDAVYSVGPLAPEIGPLIFQNTDIFPSMVEELMKDPRGLLFHVANLNITDELGRNFAFSGQEVVERTATVTIDFGNGESETYRIATAGRFDMQGRPLGISMEDALQAIGLLPWEGEDPELGSVDDPNDTRPKPTDPDVLATFGMRTVHGTYDDGETVDFRVPTRVRGVQDDFNLLEVEPEKPNDGGFWIVFLSAPVGQGSNAPTYVGTTNFDELRLQAGQVYTFAFVKDKDRDRLTSLEEFFSGCSDSLSDTDNDLLTDFMEVRGQWDADGLGAWFIYTDRLPGGYRVYSAPYLSDSDEEGMADDLEYALCRYTYDENGDPPATAFAIGTYDDTLIDPDDDDVVWEDDILPGDLPYAFPPSDGLPVDWHTLLDPETGTPVQFPSNRASLDPRKLDTDEDGISDADEVNGYYVDLFDEDPTDGIRTRVFVYSDPLSTDTDRDGLLDGMERQFGTNPVSTDSGTVFDDDLDGLPNRVEETGWLVTINGVEELVFSNPSDPDSDNDYLPDYVEWVLGTSPWYHEGQPLDPDQEAPGYDTDEDGLSDYEEWDGTVPPQDQERLAFCDMVPNCAGYQPSGEPIETDPVDADTDDDGLSDGDELAGWMVHLEHGPAGYPVSCDPLDDDTDDDGWADGIEWVGLDGLPPTDPNDALDASDPTLADTDGDGTPDAVEPTRVAGDPEDPNAPRRDPVTPDQRITVVWTYFRVLEDGVEDNSIYGDFEFDLNGYLVLQDEGFSFSSIQLFLDDVCDGDNDSHCRVGGCGGTWVQMRDGSVADLQDVDLPPPPPVGLHSSP